MLLLGRWPIALSSPCRAQTQGVHPCTPVHTSAGQAEQKAEDFRISVSPMWIFCQISHFILLVRILPPSRGQAILLHEWESWMARRTLTMDRHEKIKRRVADGRSASCFVTYEVARRIRPMRPFFGLKPSAARQCVSPATLWPTASRSPRDDTA